MHPGLDPVAARIQVLATMMIVNDGANTPHLARRPGFAAAVQGVATHVLGVDPRGTV